MTDPFTEDFPDLAPDWMQVTVRVPMDVGTEIVQYLRNAHRFYDVDWCVMGRDEDNARVDFDPCAPLTQKPPN